MTGLLWCTVGLFQAVCLQTFSRTVLCLRKDVIAPVVLAPWDEVVTIKLVDTIHSDALPKWK